MAFNLTWHELSAATPASLFLGRELNHPLGLKWNLSDLEMGKDAGSIQEFWEEALGNLKSACRKVADRYSVGRRRAQFQVGDRVMVRCYPQSSKLHQRSAKLDYQWSMPLVIAKFLSPVTVALANAETGVVVRKAHVSQLKSYYPSE
jgi:hypothetical protein